MAENYYLNHTATQIDAILTKVDGIAAGANVNVQVDWNQTTTTADDYIKNKPTIPDAQIQSDWNQTNTESKDFIKNKPTIPAAQVNSDWDAVSGVAQILNKPTIPDAQIQADWEQTNTELKDFIKNKPTIPAAQVNSDWEASSGVEEILHKPTLGTAAAKDYTTAVSGLSDDLITASAVNTALSTKANTADLATVATSGSYADLTNKPTIPAAQVNADWDSNSGVSQILNKPTIPTVDQTYDASSTNAQSGVAISGIIGNINTVLEEVL